MAAVRYGLGPDHDPRAARAAARVGSSTSFYAEPEAAQGGTHIFELEGMMEDQEKVRDDERASRRIG